MYPLIVQWMTVMLMLILKVLLELKSKQGYGIANKLIDERVNLEEKDNAAGLFGI